MCAASSLYCQLIEKQNYSLLPCMSEVGLAAHAKTSTLWQSAPIDSTWSLIMQLVYGRNERESIVKTSPQSSLLLLFSVKGMHHRAGSAECLRLSVWHSKLKTNQTDIALNTAFIVSPYLEMFTSSWWLTEVGRRDVSHFSCKRLFRSERSRLSGCCLVKLAVLSVLLRFCEYSVFLFKVLLAFHIILAGF